MDLISYYWQNARCLDIMCTHMWNGINKMTDEGWLSMSFEYLQVQNIWFQKGFFPPKYVRTYVPTTRESIGNVLNPA